MKAKDIDIGKQYIYYGTIPFMTGNKHIITVLWVFDELNKASVKYKDNQGCVGQFLCELSSLHNLHTEKRKKKQKNKDYNPRSALAQKYMNSPNNLVIYQNDLIIVVNEKKRVVLVLDGDLMGKATCHKDDKFDIVFGIYLAVSRLNYQRNQVGLSRFVLPNLNKLVGQITANDKQPWEPKVGECVRIINPSNMAIWATPELVNSLLIGANIDMTALETCDAWLNLGKFKNIFPHTYQHKFGGKVFKIKKIHYNQANNHVMIYMVGVSPEGNEIEQDCYLVSGFDGLSLA